MELPFNLDFDHIGGLFVVYGVNCLGAILIALAGWWISAVAERMARNGLLRSSRVYPVRTSTGKINFQCFTD